MLHRLYLFACAMVSVLGFAAPARADLLPSRPISLWNDRLVISGDASITVGTPDDGYFNALDYSHDAFNLLTLAVTADLRVHERISVLGQVVDEVGLRDRDFGPSNRHVLRPYALYLRVQPLADRPLFVQAGRIPPVFGAFARREYGAANPLIGLPLAYQYPTVIRPDVVPPSLFDLAMNRGEGWLVRYPAGSGSGGVQGVPLVSARRWDTGIQARWGGDVLDVAAAVTNGSLSKPLTDDDNGGKEVSARIGVTPFAALSLGASFAAGAFVGDAARASLPAGADRTYRQRAFGVDAEVSKGHVLVRGELIGSRWTTPFVSGERTRGLSALTGFVEGRLKLSPRWAVAARGERLTFSSLETGPMDPSMPYPTEPDDPYVPPSTVDANASWDAPVTRVELGASYLLRRNVRLKAAWQYDWRDGGRVEREGHAAIQLGYWF